MNNWRLLLLAVVAVLQPIGSFTERNPIDGRQEFCDHRFSSASQDTWLNGNFRKITPEQRRLSTPEAIRNEQRYEAPITRSNDRLVSERADRRISSERISRSSENRLTRDQERRERTSVGARESRQTRDERNLRTREISGDFTHQRERDALDSRRIRMSRDDTKIGRYSNERLHRDYVDSLNSRRIENSEDVRHVSQDRETIYVLRRNSNEGARETGHPSKITTFQSVDISHPNNNRNRLSLDRRIRNMEDNDRRIRFQNSRTNSFNSRDVYRSRVNSREDSRTNFRDISEQLNERQQRDQNRESREIMNNVRTDRISADRRSESRDYDDRVARTKREIRQNYNNERIDKRDLHRGVVRLSRDMSSKFPESKLSTSSERKQETRISRMSEATSRTDRLVRSNERRNDEGRKVLSRSLDRISILRTLQDERNRFLERNVRDERTVRLRRDVNSERFETRREQRDEYRLLKDQINIRKSSDSEHRQESRRSASLSRFEDNAHRERESKVRGGMRSTERLYVNHRFREHSLDRIARDTVRRNNQDSSVDERLSAIRSARFNTRQEIQDKNRASRDRAVVRMQRKTRDLTATQRKINTYGNAEISPLLRRTRSLEDNMRKIGHHNINIASRDRTSEIQESKEGDHDQRREVRGTTRDSRNIRIQVIRHRADVRMGDNFEIRRQQDESQLSKDRVYMQRYNSDSLAARSVQRKAPELASYNAEINRSERLSRNRDVRIDDREVRHNRDFKYSESIREFRRTTGKVSANRHNLAMERMDRSASRESRDVRIESKLRSSDHARNVRIETRRDVIDTRFRNFESKVRDIDATEETSEKQNAMNWQMVFYTLQGAYLCGLLMQMLTEKSSKEKSRNLTWWASSKNLVKVD